MFDIAVVGGGAGGLMAAMEAARTGSSVVLLDSKKEIGVPVQCGESISRNTLKLTGLEDDGDWVAWTVDGFRIRSISGDDMRSLIPGLCVRRDRLEKELARRAASLGAEIRSSSPVNAASYSDGVWKLGMRNGAVRARFVVVACGHNPMALEMFGFHEVIPTFLGLGMRLGRKDTGKDLLFLIKAEFEGGYGWYFPRGDEVNVGVCAKADIPRHMVWLRNTIRVRDDEILSYHGGRIPAGGLRSRLIGDSCMLVGDAGGFTNPVTKGGIIGAVLSGKEAGKAASEHLSGEVNALADWDGRMRSHVAFSSLNLKRTEFLSSLDDATLNEITGMVKGRDVNAIPSSEIMKMVFSRPELLKKAKKGVHLLRGGRDWTRWSF